VEKVVDLQAYLAGAVMLATFVLIWSARGRPWSMMNLIGSLILIGIAINTFFYIPALISSFAELHDRGIISAQILEAARNSGGVWVAVIPFLSGGVGINVFTNFLTNEKPASIDTDNHY
jgi:hypothetical protein